VAGQNKERYAKQHQCIAFHGIRFKERYSKVTLSFIRIRERAGIGLLKANFFFNNRLPIPVLQLKSLPYLSGRLHLQIKIIYNKILPVYKTIALP